jgi:GDP-4-dehydro-6-deoxy-D-mannose reductase
VRVLVTGGSGFVGRHLVPALRQRLPAQASVVATSNHPECDAERETYERLDVTDRIAAKRVIRHVAPSVVVHLGGVSTPLQMRRDPLVAWTVNVIGTLNLAHAILEEAPSCRLIFASSGLVYGSGDPDRPFDEQAQVRPTNEYAATKAAADLALGALALQGLDAVRLRLFNHTGPGQTEAFAVPAFAAQIARIESGLQPPVIKVGNLDAVRDFLGIGDVVEAYVQAVLQPKALDRGQALNIASGVPVRIGSILDTLLGLSTVLIAIREEPARIQPNEVCFCVGDATAAHRALGWAPSRDLKATLADVLSYWRRRLAGQQDVS